VTAARRTPRASGAAARVAADGAGGERIEHVAEIHRLASVRDAGATSADDTEGLYTLNRVNSQASPMAIR
jgi:hypothetical protein